MAKCPHCGDVVDAQFEHLKRIEGGEWSDGEHATFQVVCPSCESILGGAIMSRAVTKSLF